MKIMCFSCRQEIDSDHQAFSNFRGSLRCLNYRVVMEIQTMRGVLIWCYPLSDMNPDLAGGLSEHDL